MKHKKVIIICSAVVLVIVIGIILISFVSSSVFNNKDEFRDLEISTDVDDPRVGFMINFSIMNPPKNANISWNLGDGNISYDNVVMHYYDRPGYYSIHVEAVWENGRGNATIEIGVKNNDYSDNREVGVVRELQRYLGIGYSLSYAFQPGINEPSLMVEIVLTNAIGSIEFHIEAQYEYEHGYEWETLYSESTMATYQTLTFRQEIPNIHIDPEAMNIRVSGGFILWEGRIASSQLTMEVTF